MKLCDGRVVVVTGAGGGIGREHALEFARQGARLVVNDVGADYDGSGRDDAPADRVVEEIHELGGEAVASHDDVSDFDGAGRLIGTALECFGALDVLVNNAGILRDRMLANMSIAEWDAVIAVHLRGTFAPSRHASDYWRQEAKAGRPREARIINTTSGAGLFGNIGQANYSTAKGGIASFTLVAAKELSRYGVTSNAVSPAALTRMTSNSADWGTKMSGQEADRIAPLVVWLGSEESSAVTGRIFHVRGGVISLVEGYVKGPKVEREDRWDPCELGSVVSGLLERSRPPSNLDGQPSEDWAASRVRNSTGLRYSGT